MPPDFDKTKNDQHPVNCRAYVRHMKNLLQKYPGHRDEPLWQDILRFNKRQLPLSDTS